MPARITLTVVKGELQGQEFAFAERTTCLIGRAEDCHPRLTDDPERPRISRHHCLLDINPPEARIRDFGSLNGTHVNGRKIGQRPPDQRPEDASRIAFPQHDLKDGDEIKTKPTVDMSEVISQLGSLGSKLEQVVGDIGKSMGGGGDGGNVFSRIDKLVAENGPKLTTTISNLEDITTKIKGSEGTLGKLVNDPKLHDELLASVGEIKLAAADARTFMSDTKGIVADVKSGKGTLGLLLYDPATADNFKTTVANIRSVSDKIAKGEGTLGKLLADDGLYKDAQATLKKADRALDGLGEQGPITAVGVVANALF